MMQIKPSVLSLSLLLIFFHFCRTLAQTPAAPPSSAQVPPITSGTPDIDSILTKAGHFGIFVRLLKATQEDSEIFSELNTTTNGVTVFAPTDGAFSLLKVGSLNSMSDEEKTELVKFHVLTKFISSSQFQTESNPVRTKAGAGNRVSLNVTVIGATVNISTGLTNTTISGTVYSDNQLAIYQVDKVLLPLALFTPNPPAPAPAPGLTEEKPNKQAATAAAETPSVSKENSGSVSLILQKKSRVLSAVLGMLAACSLLLVM